MASSKKSALLWMPTERQAVALSCPAYELFFGGARGGGKSDFLIMDFLKNVEEYGAAHRGILFRRSMPELEEIVTRTMEIYTPLGAEFHVSSKTWTFPSGSTLRLRFMEQDSDVHKYQGHQYTWVGFDELTNWPTDYCYTWIQSSMRSATGAPVHIRSSGNPGNVGHVWVRNRFIDVAAPEHVYQDLKTGLTRVFIPSLLDDNTYMMENDPMYEKRLELLPPHLYRAYRYGDWDIFAGQVFEEWDRRRHVVRNMYIPREWFRFCSLDWGYSKPYSIGFWAVSPEGLLVRYDEMYGCDVGKRNEGTKEAPSDVARKAWRLARQAGIEDMVADPACWAQLGERSISSHFEDIDNTGVGFNMVKGNRDRIAGLNRFHDMMKATYHDGQPMIRIEEHCDAFIRTIPALAYDQKKPEDVDTKMEDHVYDEARYAIMSELATWRPFLAPLEPREGAQRDKDRERQINYDPLGRGKRESRRPA
jgi:hypothetical protein